jgi:16S rRNA (uracil1498-N3)-methyltransferase
MLPFFYIPVFDKNQQELILDEDNSRHIVQVLRMQPGQPLQLTDGKGALLTALVLDANKKKCRVSIDTTTMIPAPGTATAIAISPVKNAYRFEWFLEKAAEIGVSEIIPLLCERTERQHLRPDRLHNILVSALLQSQQTWLPVLRPPTVFARVVNDSSHDHRLIAHCLETPRPTETLTAWRNRQQSLAPDALPDSTGNSSLILIGPEGDFSPEEVTTALENGFIPVTLGNNRLRTETAGVVAATLLCIG